MTVGQALKRARTSRGLKQAELAEKMWLDKATVSLWETDRRCVKANELILMADILDMTIDELVGRTVRSNGG